MEQIPVVMVRESLDTVPQYPTPEGYRMRAFADGDGRTWVRIQQDSDPYLTFTPSTFEQSFGHDLPALRRRGFFLVAPDGRDVGTITAWYDRTYHGRRWGLIHWVAILPEHRGKGLSRSMMTVAMNRLRTLRHRRAMLRTQSHRIPAIRTYLHFGFLPDRTVEDAERAWQLVGRVVVHPALSRP